MKRIGFLFPGQGSQAVGMGKALYESSPSARGLLEEGSERCGIDFAKLLFEPNDDLNRSEFTQPAILLCSLMALKAFEESCTIKPTVALGHSLGEYGALVSVGALEPIAALKLVRERGRLMQQACSGGGYGMMVLLGLEDGVVEEACRELQSQGKGIYPANYNSEGQLVLAGNRGDLEVSQARFKELGAKRTLLLEMSVASHFPGLQGITESFGTLLQEALLENFAAPVISNVTANPYATKQEALDLLKRQLTHPVRYKQSIAQCDEAVDLFIEFGHGAVLKGLNKRNTQKPTLSISDPKTLQESLAELA